MEGRPTPKKQPRADTGKAGAFREQFEKMLGQDPIMLDNTSNVVWNDEGQYFLLTVTPKAEEVYVETRDYAVERLRVMATELKFKAAAQEVVIHGMKAVVFKVTPVK